MEKENQYQDARENKKNTAKTAAEYRDIQRLNESYQEEIPKLTNP